MADAREVITGVLHSRQLYTARVVADDIMHALDCEGLVVVSIEQLRKHVKALDRLGYHDFVSPSMRAVVDAK